jgi:hypothetical protein
MATEYTEIPTLADRIATADAAVVASIGRLVALEPDPTDGVQRVFGLFELDVQDVLKGPRLGTALLRVVGEGEDERARWLVPVGEGRRLLLLLARDVGPAIPADTYAPLHESGFELEDDRARIPEEILDADSRRVVDFDGSHVPLDGLRRFVEIIERRRDETERAVAELLPEEARTRPYAEVEERPDAAARAEDGAVHARPATIGD